MRRAQPQARVRLGRGLAGVLVAAGLALASAAISSARTAAAAGPPDLGYAKTISWHLDDAPELASMEGTIHDVLGRDHVTYTGTDGQPIDAFVAGSIYSNVYIRDSATDVPMVRYYFGAPALRSTIEEFLRLQYPDGAISAIIGPGVAVDKATTVSDEETSAILDAAEAYDALPDPAWLQQSIRGQPLIDRLNRAMTWVLTQRTDDQTGLIKRAHTTDWGDIKWEPGPDPTHMQPGDQWTISIYDQAIAYAALQGLARLDTAAGHADEAAHWQAAAQSLRQQTDAVLWQGDPSHGFYRIHTLVPPDTVVHQIDESSIIAIGNAAAVYYGLATPDKIGPILQALERARLNADAAKPGLSLDPPYPDWPQPRMGPRVYQNGALWDWWAGRQITGEFQSGYWSLARDHLLEVARDWATHLDSVYEWESPWTGRMGADQAYAGAASTVGEAVVSGLYGVELHGKTVNLSPRLGDRNGGIRVYEPATDTYVAYEYQATERGETLRYGTNSPTALAVRLPVRWSGATQARLENGDVLPITVTPIGQQLVGTVIVPSGSHTVQFRQLPPGRRKF